MLTVVMIDTSARSRKAMSEMIDRLLSSERDDQEYLPHISARSLSLEEMHFRAAPDVCLIGEQIVVHEQDKISVIRKAYPQAVLVACLRESTYPVNHIEHLARLGIDDVMQSDLEAAGFFQKVMLYSGKKRTSQKQGRLIVVDSGKGGSGVTAVTAALAEASWKDGASTLAVDLDTETQDLCRFMKVKPYVNDSLQLLLDKQRPVTEELVQEAYLALTASEDSLCLMPGTKGLQELSSDVMKRKVYHEVLLHALARFDVVLVDLSGADTCLRKFFYQRTSAALLLIENDLGAAYAALARIQFSRSVLPQYASVFLAPIQRNHRGIHMSVLQKELRQSIVGGSETWIPKAIPHSNKIGEWPGSGATISHFDRRIRKSIEQLWSQVRGCAVNESDHVGVWTKGYQSEQIGIESSAIEVPEAARTPLMIASR